MADIHKNIIITPSRGLTTDPTVVITGGGNDPMTIRGLSSGNTGTIAFEGSAGQLFAITDNMTEGDIFTVADISGLPVMSANTSRILTVNEPAVFLRGITAAGATLNGSVTVSGLGIFNSGISAAGATFTSAVNAVQGVVGGYTRIEWCGLTSGFDIIPTGWLTMDSPINTSPTANDAYFAPIFIANRMRITAIGNQTGSVGGGNTGSFIVGLYESDKYGFPTNRLYGSASTTLSTGSFAVQRITGVNTIVNPGQYWLAIVFSAAGLTGLGRMGTRMKVMTPTSSTPIGAASADALRRAQGGFTLSATQGTTFTNIVGQNTPCIFYNGEAL